MKYFFKDSLLGFSRQSCEVFSVGFLFTFQTCFCALFPGSCYASKAGDFKDRLSIEGSMDVTCVVVVSLDFCKSFFALSDEVTKPNARHQWPH